MNSQGYIAIIEWDGKKPPWSFYHRLQYLTGKARDGDRTESPIARRGGNKHPSVTMQEGAIYCADEGMARAVALLAQKYGAGSVNVARVISMAPVEATKEDLDVLRRIEEVAGRPGRPAVMHDGDYFVHCYNEMITFRHVADRKPLYCPRCGSFLINVRGYYDLNYAVDIGKALLGEISETRSILDIWIAIRIDSNGRAVPIELEFSADVLPLKETLDVYNQYVLDGRAKPAVDKLNRSGTGLGITNRLLSMSDWEGRSAAHLIFDSNMGFLDAYRDDPVTGMEILDAIFVSRWKLSRERNSHDRMVFVAEALERHTDISVPNILMSDNEVDLFDAAPRMDSARLHTMLNTLIRHDREHGITRDFYKME